MNKTQQYISTAITLGLPFFYIHTWNPFSVNGPHFLVFYILLSILFYVDMLLFPMIRTPAVIWIILILPGIARIIQGLYNEKPVMYLVILVFLNVICCTVFGNRNANT